MDNLRHTISEWIISGHERMPPVLTEHIHEKVRFLATKATICGILLMIFVVLSKVIWTTLIKSTRVSSKWSFKEKLYFVFGITTVFLSLLMMVIVVACTQGAFAPITLYLTSLM